MEKKVRIMDIVDLLEQNSERLRYILDLDSERYTFFYDANDRDLAGEDDLPENPVHYIELPILNTERDQYDQMVAFANAQEQDANERLLKAIRGKGAFSRFNIVLNDLGLFDQWRLFQDNQRYKDAVQWCKKNGISYIDKGQECKEEECVPAFKG